MTDPATPAPAPKPRVTANDRALRQMRIFARMQEGWSYEAIAQDERLSRERIRQIVTQTLALREIDAIRDHTRLLIARSTRPCAWRPSAWRRAICAPSTGWSRCSTGSTNFRSARPRPKKPPGRNRTTIRKI
jgi:hypothetical protein